MRFLSLCLLWVVLTGGSLAHAAPSASLFPDPSADWAFSLDGRAPEPIAPRAVFLTDTPRPTDDAMPSLEARALVLTPTETLQGAPPPKAVVYSDGYNVRLKIHRYLSWSTIPLMVGQGVVGQKLYNGSGGGTLRSVHSSLAAATGVLFGVNTVTGVWNLWESRNDPNGRKKRWIHSVLMLAADAAFLATASSAPEYERGERSGDRAFHRSAAFVGFGSATVGYALMLIAK
jgi:hypothetical protein